MSLLEGIKQEDAGVSLLDELENTPEETREYIESEPWRPEEAGEGIEGVIVEIYSFEGKFIDAKTNMFPIIPGWVLEVKGDETLWSVGGLHHVLRAEMAKADAQVGDRVAVLYQGTRQNKSGADYHHYRLAIRHGNGGSPVPAQAPASRTSGSTSTQHEPVAKPRRKPGASKPVGDDNPPF
jgi:hypothetical protein